MHKSAHRRSALAPRTNQAEQLALPLGTSRMFAGLKRLRELLAEAGLDVDAR